MLITNSWSREYSAACLYALQDAPRARPAAGPDFFGGRIPGAKASSGGLAHTALKNEKGARLGCPEALRLETHAIGRGATALIRM
jgi:hypothetical protein